MEKVCTICLSRDHVAASCPHPSSPGDKAGYLFAKFVRDEAECKKHQVEEGDKNELLQRER